MVMKVMMSGGSVAAASDGRRGWQRSWQMEQRWCGRGDAQKGAIQPWKEGRAAGIWYSKSSNGAR